jgi:hypothetical protein
VHETRHGDALPVAGFDVHVYDHDHALIYKQIPPVVNTGFLIDGDLFHPGDAFTVPDEPVRYEAAVPRRSCGGWVGAPGGTPVPSRISVLLQPFPSPCTPGRRRRLESLA